MKYIEYPELTQLSRALTHDSPECTVYTRIEAYTTKSVSKEKRMWRAMEHSFAEESLHYSSPEQSSLETPFGPLDKRARKTLYLLIATLNAAFPDHDFSELRPENFCKEASGASVLNALSTTLISLRNRTGDYAQPRSYSSYPPTSADFFPSSIPTSSSPVRPFSLNSQPPLIAGTHPALYRLLDEIISLPECQVFSYTPRLEADPHAWGYSDDETDDDEADSEDQDDAFYFEPDSDADSPYTSSSPPKRSAYTDSPPLTSRWRSTYSSSPDSLESPTLSRSKRRGALLWSSHWFFHNRKQKRILFISIWARRKNAFLPNFEEGEEARERFFGWEGAEGAGARAFARNSSSRNTD